MAKPDDQINDYIDFWSAAVNLKDSYLKYCKAYQSRVRTALSEFCVIPEDVDQLPHQPTIVEVNLKGLIIDWIRRTPMSK